MQTHALSSFLSQLPAPLLLDTDWKRLLALLVACVFTFLLARRGLVRAIQQITRRTQNTWDDAWVSRGVFHRLAYLVPVLLLVLAAPALEHDTLRNALQRFGHAATVLIGFWCLHAVLNALHDGYRKLPGSANRPITGFVQTVQILLGIAAVVFVIASLQNRSPLVFFTGLGAMSAVLMLVFRDSILGLVAGIQLSLNDMVRIGDWLEMPKYGADGDVIDVTLHTVKIRNWDKTISTIPTHALINDSFKNWRGMSEAGGRRIKRALWIDQHTVRFCDPALLDRLRGLELLRPYLDARQAEIDAWNRERGVDLAVDANGRRLTNLGCFRAYIEAYLRRHPQIHQESMTFLVRQLPASERGLPLEIYVFTTTTAWVAYEGIQADIMDHLLATIPLFDLAVYQAPSGRDVRAMPSVLRPAGTAD